jgi:uncharacterized membrane protein YphA (DoxX/SURF4 family)
MNLVRLTNDYFRELYTSAIDGWNRFWFTPADPATLSLIRVFAGAMIFYTHLVWTFDLEGFFGPQSRISPVFARAFHRSDWAWSHLFWIESPAVLWTVHILALIVLAMFTIGLFTRVTSVLAFLIVVAYAHRVPGALFGLDQINSLLAMYLMIGPSGAMYSIDAWLQRQRTSSIEHPASSIGPRYTSVNIAIRLIQVHMCIIYLFAGFGKLLGSTWWSGTAMWGAFGNYEYQSLDMTWLAAWPLVINFLTHLTIVWECSYCVFVWPRLTRPIVIALAVPLHLGIAVCMGMITFGLIMLVGNLAFVSPNLVRAVIGPHFGRSPHPATSL